MKKLLWSAFLFLCFVSTAQAQSAQPLFYIEHSVNKNKLYYQVQLTKDGNFDPRKPISAYWIMWEKDSTGKTREDLSMIEKKLAFGFKVRVEASQKSLTLNLVSFPQRSIKVYRNNGTIIPEVIINDKPAFLNKIFIATQESRTLPKVLFMELFGKNMVSGEQCSEKVVNTKK